MQVTRHNFDQTLPILKKSLEECEYVAIDCEMTGLFVDNNGTKNGTNDGSNHPFLQDIEDRYEDMVSSSQSFVITQFGLSAFIRASCHEQDLISAPKYVARTFNIYVFPRPFEEWGPNFLCSSSSLDFLGKCGFDFNKWVCDGVGYLPISMRDAKLAAVDAVSSRREIPLTKDADVEFVRQMVEDIRAWLKSPTQPTQLILPSVNSFRRALQYQTLRRTDLGATRAVGYYVEKITSPEDGRTALRLTKATMEEIVEFERSQRQERLNKINEAAAFVQIMELIKNVKKPVIGHNLALDLAYSVHSFIQPLPPTWPEYKKMVSTWFPGGIYDTKYLASLLPEFAEDTSLGVLFKRLEDSLVCQHDAGYKRYAMDHTKDSISRSFCHEAGYDSYMTGCVFAGLLNQFDKSGSGQSVIKPYCWRINISRSDIEYAALVGKDPVPPRSNVLLLTGPRSVTTNILSEQHKQKLVQALYNQFMASGMFFERGPSVRVYPVDLMRDDDTAAALIVFSIEKLDEALQESLQRKAAPGGKCSPAEAVVMTLRDVLPSEYSIHPFAEFRRLKKEAKKGPLGNQRKRQRQETELGERKEHTFCGVM